MKDILAPPGRLDLPGLLGALVSHRVDFVLIGGMAGACHGSAWTGLGLEIFYERRRRNLRRLAAALREIDARLRDLPQGLSFELEAATLEGRAHFSFGSLYGDIDVFAEVAGARSYEDVRAASVGYEVAGHPVAVASLADLVAMRRAGGRGRDLVIVDEYIALARRRTGRSR